MIVKETILEGVYELENKKHEDHRGSFIKIFHKGVFEENGLEHEFKESFYSVSKKNVLRGMHFQKPPHDHAKLVYVTDGEILDVAVDIRKGSPTFGKFYSTSLSDLNVKSLYMNKGFAHGFLTLSESATVTYLTTSEHAPEADSGIRWDSFGFDWCGVINPIISERDSRFLGLDSINVV
jgi:dTDP-4-dehydrorhamnose 3,5-epimerase